MRATLLTAFLFSTIHLFAQQFSKHSHNDYEQALPFYTAYQNGFESIEADVFLKDADLFVAHTPQNIRKERTLSSLYLQPVEKIIAANKGHVYTNAGKKLQLLIDIKTEAYTTLDALVRLLKNYPSVINHPNITIVISGNRPKEEDYINYPSYIFFDGRPGINYSEAVLKKVALISTGFAGISQWNGKTVLPADDRNKLVKVITAAKKLNKPFRFWGCPDTATAWKEFIKMGVDFINTDHIEQLAAFCKKYSLNQIQLHNNRLSLMPYNRIIKSTGKVVRFADPSLENHALDIVNLPGTQHVVIEDRYGLVLLIRKQQ
jgi:alkaline phosphatase